LFHAIISEILETESHLDLEIYQSTNEKPAVEDLIFDNDGIPWLPGHQHDRLSYLSRLDFGGQSWELYIKALPGFERDGGWYAAITTMICGFLISLLLFRLGRSYHVYSLRLEEEKRTLELTNDIGLSLRSDLGTEHLMKRVTDLAAEALQSQVGAFLAKAEEGKPLRLVTVKGASPSLEAQLREIPASVLKLEKFSLTGYDDELMDFNSEIAYWLSAPVVSSNGDILGVLIFGHTDNRKFTERAERLLAGIAAQAAVALDNANLVEALKASESRQRAIAEENRRLFTDAQSLNRSKDEFLATLSHELRTPLNVIQGHAELLANEPTGLADIDESIEAIYRNAKTQTQLVNDLLDVSSIILGKTSIHPVPFQITSVIQSAVEGIKFAADQKGVNLECEIADPETVIAGDPTRIKQILWNLLSNAVKFTPAKGLVKISGKHDGDFYEIRVRDTGQGIDPKFLPHVFDRFRQEDNTSTRRFGGLGLGLSIVRNLTEMHGGRVEGFSAGRNQGSEFVVRLPCTEIPRTTRTQPSAFRPLDLME
jgi:signal transduction histidine kinase